MSQERKSRQMIERRRARSSRDTPPPAVRNKGKTLLSGQWPLSVLVLSAVLLVAAPAAGDPGLEKQEVDAEIGELRQEVERAQREETVLTSEISAASSRVREVQAQVDAEQQRLYGLEAELASEREKLDRLNHLFRSQTEQLRAFEAEHVTAVAQLEKRVREIYMQDTPDALSFVLGATSFGDLLDNIELLSDIGRQDARIARRVEEGVHKTKTLRQQTAESRAGARAATRAIAARVAEQRGLRDRLIATRNELFAATEARERTLARVRAVSADHAAEIDALQGESSTLAAQIRAAQTSAPPTPPSAVSAPVPLASSGSGAPSSGFIFPVSGPVTSGFGPRGGRMHEGIDIIAASGTPVVASASGTVIRSNYGSGYGNVVVIDHENGLTTTYAHNSSLVARVGQSVSQGQLIAYVGSTGNSSGPHVHLEFRINGTAVDPFGYL